MAEKHKSKYKAPKDLEKSQKPVSRKDIKDYTLDDKDEKLNPKSTGDKQLNVIRKTDKEVVDTGDIYPKYDADDRLYKDLEDAEYEPKDAAKKMKKRQETEVKTLKDKIDNLTLEQKERLVREYFKRKIESILIEQTEEEPVDEPIVDPTAPVEEPTPNPTIPPAPTPDVAAPAPTPEAPAPDADAPTELDVETQEALAVQKFIDKLKPDGTINQIKTLLRVSTALTKDIDPADAASFYKMLRKVANEKLARLTNQSEN